MSFKVISDQTSTDQMKRLSLRVDVVVEFAPATTSKKFHPYSVGLVWTKQALDQFSRKTREIFRENSKRRAKNASLNIHFETGQEYRLIFLAGDNVPIDLHVYLRKTLSEIFVSTSIKNCIFDLTRMDLSFQQVVLNALVSLSELCSWRSQKYGRRVKSEKEQVSGPQFHVLCGSKDVVAKKIIHEATVVSQATNLVRSLADLPPNHLSPRMYKDTIRKRASKQGYKFRFFSEAELRKMNAGAFTAVTQGSQTGENGIVHLSYLSPTRGKKKRLVLVGKGLCYDTGGHNLKTGGHMYGMHRDMTGSAVALALFETFKNLSAPFELHAFLALAENCISPTAYRPNDVVLALDGTSIEVVDTDAEGRMVLADTLALARRKKPDLVLDFATLTGSAVRAVGTKRSAVFSNTKGLIDLAVQSGDASGERVWGFPLGQEYEESLKSETADLLQCSHGPGPDHILAATFLSHFIGNETPWIHVDLSADTSKGGLGLVPTDTTGFGVRWGVEFVDRYFKRTLN